jgi:hypothetical protein
MRLISDREEGNPDWPTEYVGQEEDFSHGKG